MRLPYLQVDQEALVRARTMARILAIPEAHGVGLAVSLFAWGLDMAPDGDLSGGIPDDNPAELISAAIGWNANPEKLYTAMQRVGFIEVGENELGRVRGLDRYGSILAKRDKDRERKDASRKAFLNSSAGIPTDKTGHPPDTTRKTQTQTQTHIKETKDPLSSKAGEVAVAPPPPGDWQEWLDRGREWQDRLFKPGQQPPKARARKAKAGKPPADPRHAPMVERLTEAFAKTRSGIKYGFGGRDAKALTTLLAMGSDDEIETRWRRALANTGFPVVRALGELVTHWNHFATASVANGKSPIRAEDIPAASFAVRGEIHDF